MRSIRFSVGLVCGTTIVLAAVLVIGVTVGPIAPRVEARDLAVEVLSSDVAAPQPAQLTLAADRPLVTDFQTRVRITAHLTDPSGLPLVGVPVTFGLDIPEAGKLSFLTAMTDGDVVAMTAFFPTFFRGDVTITGSVDGGMTGQTVVSVDCGC